MKSYQELIVWQKSRVFVREIYLVTEKFPKAEIFGLTSQMRRSAVSIPSNIAEGFSRKHRKEWRQFLLIAFGSVAELETQLILSRDLNFLSRDDFSRLIPFLGELGKMLNKMITNLNSSSASG